MLFAGLVYSPEAGMGLQSKELPPATVEIEFTNVKLLPPHWVLKLTADGSGYFDADRGNPSPEDANQILVGEIHRPVQLSVAFAAKVFETARQKKLFTFPCESHMKVAFQGTKHLSYSGPDGHGECEYNYSKDKDIEALGESLLAVANTVVFGARLEKLLQHDRLGLDKAMEDLVTAVHDKNALEMSAIQATLQRIATDDQVLERARKRARLLLDQAK